MFHLLQSNSRWRSCWIEIGFYNIMWIPCSDGLFSCSFSNEKDNSLQWSIFSSRESISHFTSFWLSLPTSLVKNNPTLLQAPLLYYLLFFSLRTQLAWNILWLMEFALKVFNPFSKHLPKHVRLSLWNTEPILLQIFPLKITDVSFAIEFLLVFTNSFTCSMFWISLLATKESCSW